MNEHLFKMIFYFETDAISEFDVIQWAMNQYVNGNNSESMIQLASITINDKNKVRTLLERSLKDLGFDYPSKQSLGYYRAKLVSQEIIKGKILPERGCRLIGRICSDLEEPEILKEFGVLNQQLIDNRNMELNEEKIMKMIISSASKLIDNVNLCLKLV